MSELDNHFPEIVQNLLTNVTVGRDINIDAIQQIAQQIIIQVADNHHSNPVAILITTQILELFKTKNVNAKKFIVLQLLKICQYDENLPIELRQEANNLYAEFDSLNPAQFKDLFTPSVTYNHLNQKLALFLLGILTGMSVNILKKMWNSWVLVDNYDISANEGILTNEENLPTEIIELLSDKNYHIYSLSDNPVISETETRESLDSKYKNISLNAEHKPILNLNKSIINELNYKQLMLIKIMQETHLIDEINTQELSHFKGAFFENLPDIEVHESIIRLEGIEKIMIDIDSSFGEYYSNHEFKAFGEEHDLNDGDDDGDDFGYNHTY
jgi:hypothetical protein